MFHQVKNYVRSCEVCQRAKFHNNTKKVPMGELSIPKIAFSRIYVDIAGPFPVTCPEKHRFVVAFQCATSNFVIARAISEKSSDTIAKTMVEEVILNFGAFSEIYSDQAAELISSVVKKTLNLLKIDNHQSIIYNAQSNKVERFNASLKTYIRTFLSDQSTKDHWCNAVRLAQFIYNVTPSCVTGFSPYQLIFGRIPIDNITNLSLNPIYTFDDYYDQLRGDIKAANAAARNISIEKKRLDREKINKNSSPKSFSPGQKILVKNYTASGLDNKFENAEIVQDLSPQHVLVKRRRKIQPLHKNDVIPLVQRSPEVAVADAT